MFSIHLSLNMKTLLTEETLKVPKGVKITIKSKKVEVKGKHGDLTRDFKHLPIELYLGDGGKKVIARMYFAKSKQCSMLNTVTGHQVRLSHIRPRNWVEQEGSRHERINNRTP